MTRDDVIRCAREAGFQTGVIHAADGSTAFQLVQAIGTGCIVELEHFADLVAAAERSACAKLCMDKAHKMEREAVDAEDEDDGDTRDSNRATAWVLAVCSQEILARKDKP